MQRKGRFWGAVCYRFQEHSLTPFEVYEFPEPKFPGESCWVPAFLDVTHHLPATCVSNLTMRLGFGYYCGDGYVSFVSQRYEEVEAFIQGYKAALYLTKK